ncbi:MAG: DUF1501 domain-containing protein [Campylobacterota bacterium]|nr:DUF1501 domain-containing protein [Campylobacterota bacterium]
MKRRNFIKLSLAASASLMLPSLASADTDYSEVNFDENTYTTNSAQVIMVFLYGGASQLAGNLTNIDEIKEKSQSSYDSYFRGITPTPNNFWQEAGGTHLEDMLSAGDMTLYRTCYSKVREENNNKAHGSCTVQNQKGSFNETSAGIVTNLSKVLSNSGIINEDSVMPFVSMEGDSNFYASGNTTVPSYLKAVGLNQNLDNPYKRNVRYWFQYTAAEREITDYNKNDERGFDPAFNTTMNEMAQKNNLNTKIHTAFSKREPLSRFITDIKSSQTPDLGLDAYPTNDSFAQTLESSIKVMAKNPDTKVISMNTGGLGGWDDHNDARNYTTRCENLFKTLKSSMAHLKALEKENNISIMVFSEFGRNVNLNSALGWDHGNLQNFLVLGGKKYFDHKGVIGETKVESTGAVNRLYLKPTDNSYSFEPLSIAATLYKVFGITNPETLTDGNSPVEL